MTDAERMASKAAYEDVRRLLWDRIRHCEAYTSPERQATAYELKWIERRVREKQEAL